MWTAFHYTITIDPSLWNNPYKDSYLDPGFKYFPYYYDTIPDEEAESGGDNGD